MYVIEINGHEVFMDIEFALEPGEHNPMTTKCEIITGFSPNGDYITETAPVWLRDMIEDTNLLYWDIVGQDEPEIAHEPVGEAWCCGSPNPGELD